MPAALLSAAFLGAPFRSTVGDTWERPLASSVWGPACNNAVSHAPKVPPAVLHDMLPKARPAMLPGVLQTVLQRALPCVSPAVFRKGAPRSAAERGVQAKLSKCRTMDTNTKSFFFMGGAIGCHLPHCPLGVGGGAMGQMTSRGIRTPHHPSPHPRHPASGAYPIRPCYHTNQGYV